MHQYLTVRTMRFVSSDLELLFGFLYGLLHCEGAVCVHNMGHR